MFSQHGSRHNMTDDAPNPIDDPWGPIDSEEYRLLQEAAKALLVAGVIIERYRCGYASMGYPDHDQTASECASITRNMAVKTLLMLRDIRFIVDRMDPEMRDLIDRIEP
jgi:hypothetical protein